MWIEFIILITIIDIEENPGKDFCITSTMLGEFVMRNFLDFNDIWSTVIKISKIENL